MLSQSQVSDDGIVIHAKKYCFRATCGHVTHVTLELKLKISGLSLQISEPHLPYIKT